MFLAPRKHQYTDPGVRPMPEQAPNWVGYICVHCNDRSGLDGWQIAETPKEMALCPSNDAPRMTLWEFLWGCVDCMAPVKGAVGLLTHAIARLRATDQPKD